MSKILESLKNRLEVVDRLDRRRRLLPRDDTLLDFSSNDYLGLAKTMLSGEREAEFSRGAGASRLLSGTSSYMLSAEKNLADFYQAEDALVFSSGYQANLGVLSGVVTREDYICYDESVHASIRDGIQLSFARSTKFKHNSIGSLREKLSRVRDSIRGNIFIFVESVYSMDGDIAPLTELVEITLEFGGALIVDEAHSTGLFGEAGEGLVVELGLQDLVFARIHTFGKAVGSHGACVVGDAVVKEALVNFSRPFIFTTAPPEHYFNSIVECHHHVAAANDERKQLQLLHTFFDAEVENSGVKTVSRGTAIKAVIVPGNSRCRAIADFIQMAGYDVRAVLSPTVPTGSERLRICLHSFNSKTEVLGLLEKIDEGILQYD